MIQKTLVLIKPDGVQRALIGRIMQRFEDVGLKIVAMRMKWIDKDFASKHYNDIKEKYGERIFENLAKYITGGPVLAMVLEGVEAIKIVRKLVGSTYPFESAPGTIRGDFSHISKDYANKHDKKISNLIHASSNIEDAKREVELWFKNEEIHDYSVVHEIHTV